MKSKCQGNQPGSDFQQEWIVFNQRRFEGLEIAKEQLNKELSRQRTLNSRMGEEIEHLRGQLRTSGKLSIKFELAYEKWEIYSLLKESWLFPNPSSTSTSRIWRRSWMLSGNFQSVFINIPH